MEYEEIFNFHFTYVLIIDHLNKFPMKFGTYLWYKTIFMLLIILLRILTVVVYFISCRNCKKAHDLPRISNCKILTCRLIKLLNSVYENYVILNVTLIYIKDINNSV